MTAKGGRAARRRRRERPSSDVAAAPAWRLPVVFVVVAALALAAVAERRDDLRPVAPIEAGPVLSRYLPTAASPGSTGSVWFCAAGTATGSATGRAEQTVVMLNDSAQASRGRLTAYPDHGEPAARDIDVPAYSRTEVRVSDVVKADNAAALVELSGGEVAVEHHLHGPTGDAVAACASAASDRAYLPLGATRTGATELIAVFNPFPEDALLEFRFETDDGTRLPSKLNRMAVPGGRVTVIDLTTEVTVREQIATSIDVRAGRVVVDQVQIWDGKDGQATGLALVPAAPLGATAWLFSGGSPLTGTAAQQLAVLDTGKDDAEVEVRVHPDSSEAGTIEPFDVTVRGHKYSLVPLSGQERLPQGSGMWTVVASAHDVPVVAGRAISVKAPGDHPTGISMALGSPVVASRWLVPAGRLAGAKAAQVSIANPTDRPVTIDVNAVAKGASGPVEGFDGAQLGPGQRVTVDLTRLQSPELGIEVVSAGGGVVVEHRLVFDAAADFTDALAVPVDGTLALPPPLPPLDVDLGRGAVGTIDLDPNLTAPATPPTTAPGASPGTGLPGTLPTDTPVVPPGTLPNGSPAPAAPPDTSSTTTVSVPA